MVRLIERSQLKNSYQTFMKIYFDIIIRLFLRKRHILCHTRFEKSGKQPLNREYSNIIH